MRCIYTTRFASIVLLLAALLAADAPALQAQSSEKVVICHIPPGNPANAHTISVSPSALAAHLAHGDTVGECEEDGEDDDEADLAVEKTVNDPTPDFGTNVTFTVTITNNGPDDADDVEVTDLLPAGLDFVSATTTQGTYNDVTGSWGVGTVMTSTATLATLTIDALVNTLDPVTNTATITNSSIGDPDPSNNTDSATVTPQGEDDDDGENEVELTGTIEALDAGSITVDGITFVVTDETVILDDDNNSITLDDLAVGMTIEIRGEHDADGVLVATNIKIEDPPAAAGRIETMEDDRLTVEERTFLIDDSTRVLDASAAPISFSDLEVGLTVAVHARTAAAAAMPVAAQIKVVGEGDVASALEEAESDVPVRFVLGQNYPNPFNPQTTIRFSVPETAQVTLVVYDMLGRQVRVLVDGVRETGIHEAVFEAGNLPSGVYLYRLTAGSISQTKRMTLLK